MQESEGTDDSTNTQGDPGSWKGTIREGTRDKFKCMSTKIFPRGASLYSVHLDEELGTRMYNVEPPFLPNVKSLDKLRRFRMRVPSTFPLSGTSFSLGFYIYIHLLRKSGQPLIASTLLGLFHKIQRLMTLRKRQGILDSTGNCDDDFVRKTIKTLSGWSFPRVFSDGPAYMLLMHLENLGGQSPWTEEQIINDISTWVSGTSEGDFDLLKPYYDRALEQWGVPLPGQPHLSFKEYCSDILRWGTSGGARKVTFFGEEFRSKWAWAFSKIIDDEGNLLEDVSLYDIAMEEGNVCKVALKEETKKTRQIITTPMASYLRQCYLVYRWGRLRGDTPISEASWLGRFQNRQFSWYGCADAERFDHSVSKQMIQYIITRLGDIDEETREIARVEAESLDNLTIQWGKHTWEYKGGLLSGWRLTSIIGTLTSMAIGNYVVHKGKLDGSVIAAMGDDIMIASPRYSITKEQLYKYYADTHFNVNLKKTITGEVGEFLRQTYSERGIFGYPALALPTIVYASPWLTNFQLSHEQEISHSWLTLYSRLLPHSLSNGDLRIAVERYIEADIRQHSRLKGNIRGWLHTPISAGGGGPTEWSDTNNWTIISTDIELDTPADYLLSLFNIIPKHKRVERALSKQLVPLDMGVIKKDLDSITRIQIDKDDVIPKDVNKTYNILRWYLGNDITISGLERSLQVRIPRFLRVAPKRSVLNYLLGIASSASGITSVQTTAASTSVYSKVFNTLSRVFSSNRRTSGLKQLGAIVTLYTMHKFGSDLFVSGTW